MSASDWTESSAGLLSPAAGTATAMNERSRLWPVVVIVLLQAASVLIPAMIAPGSFPHFMAMVFGPILVFDLIAGSPTSRIWEA
jgi:hypothetical protein